MQDSSIRLAAALTAAVVCLAGCSSVAAPSRAQEVGTTAASSPAGDSSEPVADASTPQAPSAAEAIAAAKASRESFSRFTLTSESVNDGVRARFVVSYMDFADPEGDFVVSGGRNWLNGPNKGLKTTFLSQRASNEVFSKPSKETWEYVLADQHEKPSATLLKQWLPASARTSTARDLTLGAHSLGASIFNGLKVDDTAPGDPDPTPPRTENFDGRAVYVYESPGLRLRVTQSPPHRLVSLEQTGFKPTEDHLVRVVFSEEGKLDAKPAYPTLDETVPGLYRALFAVSKFKAALERESGLVG